MTSNTFPSGATSVFMEGTDARLRGTNQVFAGDIDESMSFHSLPTTRSRRVKDMYSVLTRSSQGRRILFYLCINIIASIVLLLWCQLSNSMSMTALAYLTVFDIAYLLTAAVSLWTYSKRSTAIYSFGYERFEVLAVFSSTMLAQLGSFFIFKESIEKIFEPHHIHIGRLPLGAATALVVHNVIIYSVENIPFQHVIQAASSSWLQEHVTDISESICHVIPALSKILLPRINPLTLLGCASSLSVFSAYLAIDLKNYQGSDIAAAICIGVFTIATMFPMASYTGKILLQTTPTHMIGQLDKCLREACTLDGVLEFRNEHFWTLGFGKLAGSVHVRVRRDANDQLVLAHVYSRLSSLVSYLTIQIFKDDWSRSSAYQIIHGSATPPLTPIRPLQPPSHIDRHSLPLSSVTPFTSTPYGSPSRQLSHQPSH